MFKMDDLYPGQENITELSRYLGMKYWVGNDLRKKDCPN